MARHFRFLCLVVVLALTTNGFAWCSIPIDGQTATTVAITAANSTVAAGSPVFVNVVVTNNSSKDIPMWATKGHDQGGWRYQVDARDARGKLVIETRSGSYHNGHLDLTKLDSRDLGVFHQAFSGFWYTLKAGQSLTDKVEVTRLYALDEPGTYTIGLALIDPVSGVVVKSNRVSVTITPVPAAASAPATEQPRTSAPLSLSIKADSDAARPNLPVDVLVDTKNVSTHSIVLRRQERAQDPAMLGSVFRIDVLDSQGNAPIETGLSQSTNNRADTPPDSALMISARAAGTVLSIGPGEVWRNTIRVSDLYDLSKPGQYTIQVRRWDDETKTWVKSNTITVTVTP
jgi:hypothetical protein